jgi:hypothetical protein
MSPFTTFLDPIDTDANGIEVRRSVRPTPSAARNVVVSAAEARAGLADNAAADCASQTLASSAHHALLVRPIRSTSP